MMPCMGYARSSTRPALCSWILMVIPRSACLSSLLSANLEVTKLFADTAIRVVLNLEFGPSLRDFLLLLLEARWFVSCWRLILKVGENL